SSVLACRDAEKSAFSDPVQVSEYSCLAFRQYQSPDVCTRSHFPALFLSLTQNTWWHEKDCGGQEND
ncbi:TPA: hypothetical protein ACH9PM_005332, partial [Escherichia coli]|uniref:hypothetical protein n=1 Tax=Escherichia coli TaxID=562 RepID=UPI001BCFC446